MKHKGQPFLQLTRRIKGQKFDVPSLLTGGDLSVTTFAEIAKDAQCGLAISRLAPQDYHRFHSPVEGTVVAIKDIAGEVVLEATADGR